MKNQCPKCRLICRSERKKWNAIGYYFQYSCSCGYEWHIQSLIVWNVPRSEVAQWGTLPSAVAVLLSIASTMACFQDTTSTLAVTGDSGQRIKGLTSNGCAESATQNLKRFWSCTNGTPPPRSVSLYRGFATPTFSGSFFSEDSLVSTRRAGDLKSWLLGKTSKKRARTMPIIKIRGSRP